MTRQAEGKYQWTLVDGEIIPEGGSKAISAYFFEGWATKLGVYNGVTVTVRKIQKLQSDAGTKKIHVDATSKIIFNAYGRGTSNNDVYYYVANDEGVTWNAVPENGGYTAYYYLTGNGSVKYSGNAGFTHNIKACEATLSAETSNKKISKKLLVKIGGTSKGTLTVPDDVSVTIKNSEGTAVTATKVNSLSLEGNIGDYTITSESDGIVLSYVDYSAADPNQTISLTSESADSTVIGAETQNLTINVSGDCTLTAKSAIDLLSLTINKAEGAESATLKLAADGGSFTVGNHTIGTGVTLDLATNTGIKKSTTTNNGSIRVSAGTESAPIVIVEDGAGNTGIGTILVSANAVAKIEANGSNKIYKVTGDSSATSKVIVTSSGNWGISSSGSAQFNKITLINQGAQTFYIERGIGTDVALAPQGPVAVDGKFSIVALSGSGNISKSGWASSAALTLTGNVTSTYSGTCTVPLTINAGTLETGVGNNLAGKTISIAAGAILSYVNNSDRNHTGDDFSNITGTGKIVLSGSGYVALPSDSTKVFADTLEIENNLSKGIVVPVSMTVGTYSGTGNLRYDWNSDPRTLTIKQAKNTTWSGGISSSDGHSKSNRALDICVKSDNGSVLTVSGTVNGPASSTLTAGEGGTIKITGSCTGTGVVLDGGKLQSTGSDGAHGTMVKSLKLLKDGTYEWVAGNSEQIGIGANSVESTLDLNNHKITFVGKGTDTYNRVYLDKTTIASAGTIEVTKGRLFVHCQMPTFPEGTKIIIGSNATIEIAPEIEDKTMTVSELEYNGTVDPLSNGVPLMVVTSKFSGTGSIKNLTLGDGAEVSGSATVTTSATAEGTVTLADGATLTVPTAFTANTVKSGVVTKRVVETTVAGGTKYSLETIPEPPTPTAGGITPNIPGAETIEITVATGPGEATISGTTIPLETGLYTVKGKVGATVVGTQNIGVVVADDGTAGTKTQHAVAVPFKGKTVATLLNTACLSKDDTLMAWIGGKYEVWMLDADKNWVEQTTHAQAGDHIAPAAAETALKRGQAVWVTTAGKIVTFGDTAAEGEEVVLTTGHNLLGNIAYADATPDATEGQQVQLIGDATKTRYNKTADGWSWIKQVTTTVGGETVITNERGTTAPVVPVGKGYWLIKPAAK